MAVDGRKLNKPQGCQFPCSPCSKEGRNVTAIKHCIDCDENFCASCLKDHNKFSLMRGHQMLDQVQSPSGARPKLPQQRCIKHGGKLIDVYCPGHDKVCCSTCIALEHGSCHGISFIPDVAMNIGTSNELQQFESKMASLKSRCISLSQGKDTNLQTLKQDKIELIGEIRKLRKKINDHFDEMERKLVDEADAKFEEKINHVCDNKNEIQGFLADLKKTEQRLQEAKSNNESELFVLLKTERPGLEHISNTIDKMECAGTTNSLKLTIEKRVEQVLDGECGIGEVEDKCYQNILTTFLGEYDTTTENETRVAGIAAICLCQGHIFLIDYNNKRLKKVDDDYKMMSYLSMPHGPVGICNVDDKQLAVTIRIDKKVQFVSCTEPMQLLTAFHVGAFCRGIEYKKGLLFVCCGGDKNEGAGHVEVYSVKGTLMRSFYDMTGIPRRLCVSRDGRCIYITYWSQSRLGIFGTYGDVVHQCEYQEVIGGNGLCRLNAKLLCISGRKSHNIAVITNDGQLQQMFLTQKDGIKSPLAVCFDEKQSRLIVSTRDSGKIQVFQLNLRE